MYQFCKTLLIAVIIATIDGQPVSENDYEEIDPALGDSAAEPAVGLQPNKEDIESAISNVFGPKVPSVTPKVETAGPKPNNENTDFLLSQVFGPKNSSVDPKVETVQPKPNNEDTESLLSQVFGPKGSSANVTGITDQPTAQEAKNAGSSNQEKKNNPGVSPALQNCMRGGELGVCVPYYLCKKIITDSDEDDSDENEKGIDINGSIPDFCLSYVEVCCSPEHTVEKSEVQKS